MRLLDIKDCMHFVNGHMLEIEDCGYELVESVVASHEPSEMFKDADICIFLGGFPRK